MSIPNLLGTTNFAKFTDKDTEWWLGAAGSQIRDYCGWHIYPVITETVTARLGNEGIIVLPTLNISAVEELTINNVVVPESAYVVHSAGWIQLARYGHTTEGGFGAVWAPQSDSDYVSVTMQHGFTELPAVVEEVGFSLAARAMEKPAGVAKSIDAGPHRIVFNEFGPVLTDEAKCRLAPYRVVDL